MAKNFYAIKRGYDKEKDQPVHDLLLTDWDEAKKFVKNVDNARYKGFDTSDAALDWLEVVDKLDGITDSEKKAKEGLAPKSGLDYFTSNEVGKKSESISNNDILNSFQESFDNLKKTSSNISAEDKLEILVTIVSETYKALGLK